jgi:acetyltransferase-like isoleucine patch superfamily enzyme
MDVISHGSDRSGQVDRAGHATAELGSRLVLERQWPEPTGWDRVRGRIKRAAGEVVRFGWSGLAELGAIGPDSRAGRRFGRFGQGSVICFPPNALFNERYIHIGAGTMIGPGVTLSAGMVPGQVCVTDPVVRIGDRCLIGKGSGIVGHLCIDIGDDVWTGHHVYITDQNHGYEDVTVPISRQSMPERAVSIGGGSWIGHGTVVLPGTTIGRHVVIGANSVVSGSIPDFSVAVGTPAQIVRSYDPETGWVSSRRARVGNS